MSTPSPPSGGPAGFDPAAAPTRKLTPPSGPPPPARPASGGPGFATRPNPPATQFPPAAQFPPATPFPPAAQFPPRQYPPTAQYPSPPAQPSMSPPRRRTGRLVAIILGVVVLLGGAAFGAFLLFGPKYLDEADLERQLTEAGRGFASAAQSASCPADLRAEKDRSLDCTVRLADGSEVPAKVTVTAVDGGQATFTRQIAVLPQADLEERVSADVAEKYKAIPMACEGDLVGLAGKSTTCEGTDTAGEIVQVRATFDKLGPDLAVEATYAPFKTAEQLATEVEAIYTGRGLTTDVTCDGDLEGKVDATTTCTVVEAGAETVDVTVTVTKVNFGYILIYSGEVVAN